MFSVDSFYDYLMHKYTGPEKSNLLYKFPVHGDKNLYSMRSASAVDKHWCKDGKTYEKLLGALVMFDQEPVSIDGFYFELTDNELDPKNYYHYTLYNKAQAMSYHLARFRPSIICHSEKNSIEIAYFRKQGFLDVHYWYHGLVARDWFRHWKHYTPHKNNTQNRLGCYIRDTSGTREYRKDVLELIKQEGIYCPMLQGEIHSSKSSALLEWNDTSKFDIHVVAETLFDTPKTHLTEKVLKPIAMEQPFVLFAGPNSLEYMRNYGFQTFACCWDESYDEIEDSEERYHAVTDLIKHLNSLPDDRYNRIVNRAKLIAKNNREHFHSQQFEKAMLTELDTNMDKALKKQQCLFDQEPGRMYLDRLNHFKQLNDANVPEFIFTRANDVVEYLKHQDPDTAHKILGQYPNLF